MPNGGVTLPRGGVSLGPQLQGSLPSPTPKQQDGLVVVKEGTLESLGCPGE